MILPNFGSSVLRYRKRFDRGIKIHFQNEWSFIDNARSVLRAKEKPLNRAFRQTDRLRRAISVPSVDITLSLFTSMMLGRSRRFRKERGNEREGKRRRNDDSEVLVSDCLRKIHVQGKRTVDIGTWNQLVSRDTSSCLASAFVVIELRRCCYVTFYPRSVSRENPTERFIYFHLSRSCIVTKWNEASSASRWPTIESCNSKC